MKKKTSFIIGGTKGIGSVITKKLKLRDLMRIYINRGPGSFAGIRNSLSVVKAINLALKIDYYLKKK